MIRLTVDEEVGTVAFSEGSQVEAAGQHSHLVDDHAVWVAASGVGTQSPTLALRTGRELLEQVDRACA